MAKRDSLGTQFRDVIGKKVRQMSYEKTLKLLKGVCNDILSAILFNKLFGDVTGNTTNSFAVGLFYKGKRVYSAFSYDRFERDPLMKTLKKGQEFPFEEYYDGELVNTDVLGNPLPYEGEFGHGGQWGPSLARNRLSRMRSRVRDTWNIVAICPIEYAEFNGNILHTMTLASESIPEIVSNNVFYVRSKSSGPI